MMMKMMKISQQLFLAVVQEEKNLQFLRVQKQNQNYQQLKVNYQNNSKESCHYFLLFRNRHGSELKSSKAS